MSVHVPVMCAEALQWLRPERGGVFVDCTVGLGGHTRALLDGGATRVLGVDRDPQALALAGEALAAYGDRVSLVHADYRQVDAVLQAQGIELLDGALADLGVSSLQFDAAGRGFSFMRDEPLDMRMDTTRGISAAEWLAVVDERQLEKVIRDYGEERFAFQIAKAIVARRAVEPISSTRQLAAIVANAVKTDRKSTRLNSSHT